MSYRTTIGSGQFMNFIIFVHYNSNIYYFYKYPTITQDKAYQFRPHAYQYAHL